MGSQPGGGVRLELALFGEPGVLRVGARVESGAWTTALNLVMYNGCNASMAPSTKELSILRGRCVRKINCGGRRESCPAQNASRSVTARDSGPAPDKLQDKIRNNTL